MREVQYILNLFFSLIGTQQSLKVVSTKPWTETKTLRQFEDIAEISIIYKAILFQIF